MRLIGLALFCKASMKKIFLALFLVSTLFFGIKNVSAQVDSNTDLEEEDLTVEEDATASSTVLEHTPVPTTQPRQDITKETVETVEPLKKLLDEQVLGSLFPSNFIKYAIRGAVDAGVPPNTIVLLLLLPGIASIIAVARHIVGIRGFGIFLPAALAVSFVAIGPPLGIVLFLVIVFVSTSVRMILRKTKIKMQYLPRMAILLLFVVLGLLMVLFAAPIIKHPALTNVSIFPVLILVLLAEEFSKVQLGKSAKVAINLTSETLILALFSYVFLTTNFIQRVALLYPEIWIIFLFVFNILIGRYVGLRIIERIRFRKLLQS